LMTLAPPCSTLFPYTTLFRSVALSEEHVVVPAKLDLRPVRRVEEHAVTQLHLAHVLADGHDASPREPLAHGSRRGDHDASARARSEEHTSELQSRENLVCRLL